MITTIADNNRVTSIIFVVTSKMKTADYSHNANEFAVCLQVYNQLLCVRDPSQTCDCIPSVCSDCRRLWHQYRGNRCLICLKPYRQLTLTVKPEYDSVSCATQVTVAGLCFAFIYIMIINILG